MSVNLIVCNGAYKSGSTWVEKIVREVLEVTPFERDCLDEYQSDSLNFNKIEYFFKNSKSGNYVTKSHESSPIRVGEGNQGGISIKVLMIKRDPRAIFLSYYHHFCRSVGFKIPILLFYYCVGKYKLVEVYTYNSNWMEESDVLWLNYEDLHGDIEGEINKVADFLKVSVDVSAVVSATSISSLRNKEKSLKQKKFYRKGSPYEWKTSIPHSLSNKIVEVYRNPCLADRLVTWFLFDLRRKLFKLTFFRGV